MFCLKATQIYGWPFRATEEPVQHLAAQKFCFTLWQNDLQSSWHLIYAAEYRESSTDALDFFYVQYWTADTKISADIRVIDT